MTEREHSTRTATMRGGRPAATSHAELSHIALELFTAKGFDATTVDDIAAAAGIGRRTFFRYFSSKNDVVWGDFEAELDRMRSFLHDCPPTLPITEALHAAVLDFNQFPDVEAPWHRRRMRLILEVPTLQAHSTLRYAAWREVVADYVAARLDVSPDSMRPQALAYAFLGVCIAAYDQWLRDEGTTLRTHLDSALSLLVRGFTGLG